MHKSTLVAGASLLLSATASAGATTWDIDPAHSSAQFSVRHMMVSNVRGEFSKLSGVVVYDPADLKQARVEATIDAASITTRNADRDKHLQSPDFFDVAKYPTLVFKSKRVETGPGGTLKLIGDLTMHGVTREVVLDVAVLAPEAKDPWGNVKSGVAASTTINRKDFGLLWNKTLEAGGVLVGDQVQITLDIELTKKAAAAAATR